MSEAKFTDDDLKGLKRELTRSSYSWVTIANDAFKLEALLARLEAAEKTIEHLRYCKGCRSEEEYKAWRKAAGK